MRGDGYHELESLFYPLSRPHDVLDICPRQGYGLDLVCENFSLPQAGNILNSAYSEFAIQSGCAPGVFCRLRKNVPVGAGLGGGSADAAFFLQWLNRHCGHPLDEAALLKVAASLGGDVPFFLINAPALVSGKGEKITRVPFAGHNFFLVLVWPQIHIATAWAFAAWDKLHEAKCLTYGQGKVKNFIPSGAAPVSSLPGLDLRNDLEGPVFASYPDLADLKKFFMGMGAFHAAMSGSGSTIYGLFAEMADARKATTNLRKKYRHVYFETLRNVGM